MAQVSGQGTIVNLPNYSGELFTADLTLSPFFSMIGGLNGMSISKNQEFATSSEYDFPAASQPAISETASLTAPAGTEYVREQVKNAIGLHQEAIKLSYNKLANSGRMSGLNTAGQMNNVSNEMVWQTDKTLIKMIRDMEYVCFQGAYQEATNSATPGKSRGLIAATGLTGGTSNDASAATLSKTLFEQLLQDMFDAGAPLINPVVWVNGYQKRKLSEIYGYAPEDRNIGGVNIKQIETDFGVIGVAAAHRFMPTSTLLLADMSVVKPVGMEVPGKGNFFEEDLAKTGASDNKQLVGYFGVDHGPAFAHGTLTNLATS